MALLLKQKEMYGIINGYNDKLQEPAPNMTATEKAAFKDWINRHCVARSTILLGMEPRIQDVYMVIDDAKTLWEKLALAYKSKLTFNIFEIREDLWSIKLHDCGDADNYASRIDQKVKDYNLCPGLSTTDTDADTESAMTIGKMSEQEHIIYLLRGIPRNDEWKVSMELMTDKNAKMTAMPNEIVTKLVEMKAAIKRENGLAPDTLLFAKKGGKGGTGGNCDKTGRGSKSPNRDKREDKSDNKNDRKEKDFRKCFYWQRPGHTTKNGLSKKRSDPPNTADTAAQASATSTLTTSIENYWMVASSNASASDWFIDCKCMTHISGHRSMFNTYSKYPLNTKEVKGYDAVTCFASGYESVRLFCPLPDGKTETIILHEVVHLPESFNLISQSQIMDKDVKVEPVNHYGVNLNNRHGRLIATAPQVDGQFILDRSPESTEYTDIDDSCLLALKTSGHASWHDAEKRMLWHRHLAHVSLKALEIVRTITDTPKMTR